MVKTTNLSFLLEIFMKQCIFKNLNDFSKNVQTKVCKAIYLQHRKAFSFSHFNVSDA